MVGRLLARLGIPGAVIAASGTMASLVLNAMGARQLGLSYAWWAAIFGCFLVLIVLAWLAELKRHGVLNAAAAAIASPEQVPSGVDLAHGHTIDPVEISYRPPEEVERKVLEKYVYAGSYQALFDELAEKHIFYLNIVIFNGARERITVRNSISGTMKLDGVQLDSPPRIQLPKDNEKYLEKIERGEERGIILYQRVPPDLAVSVADKLERGDYVQIVLQDLVIEIVSSANTYHRLKTYQGLNIQKKVGVTGKAAFGGGRMTVEAYMTTGPGYTVGKWGEQEHPNYQCTECSYATLDKKQIIDHLRGRHKVTVE